MTAADNDIGRHLDHETLCMWLALVRLGGYWSVRQLRAEGHQAMHPPRMRRGLDRLALNGMVRRKEVHGQHVAYGVTTRCKAPPGYEHVMQGESA